MSLEFGLKRSIDPAGYPAWSANRLRLVKSYHHALKLRGRLWTSNTVQVLATMSGLSRWTDSSTGASISTLIGLLNHCSAIKCRNRESDLGRLTEWITFGGGRHDHWTCLPNRCRGHSVCGDMLGDLHKSGGEGFLGNERKLEHSCPAPGST